jgi:hypothetical protein
MSKQDGADNMPSKPAQTGGPTFLQKIQRRALQSAAFGMALLGLPGPFIDWKPEYWAAGEDVTWIVGTVQLMFWGVVGGGCLGAIGGLVEHWFEAEYS